MTTNKTLEKEVDAIFISRLIYSNLQNFTVNTYRFLVINLQIDILIRATLSKYIYDRSNTYVQKKYVQRIVKTFNDLKGGC